MTATATAHAIISCNAALFKAALTFAGNKDVRFYLNGVRIEPSPDGVGVRIIATDGHRLAVLFDPDGRYSCDGCETVTERANLTARADGYMCPDCAPIGDYATGIEPVSTDQDEPESEPVSTGVESEPVSTSQDQPVSIPEPSTGVDQMAAIIAHQLEDASPRDLAPIFSHARYAKKSYAVRCPSPDGYKTRAARLVEALRGRYSGREHAYIMPRTKALKLARLWSNGWDACFYSGKLEEPRDNVTRIEPYREAKQRQRARWNATAGTWQPVSAAA